ncbi:hypothetical protein D1AOALGA4SA_4980 [Olavius algarvensis Delta 1 endosymbiont]|nr:hypothetical protein D1AOALGA4SA_4980 [Olavius algarvensis Delta 1 endosymbiont]
MEVGLRQAQTRQSGNAEGGKKAGGQLNSEVGMRKSENRKRAFLNWAFDKLRRDKVGMRNSEKRKGGN